MILQAFEYEELEREPGRLQDFYDSTAGKASFWKQSIVHLKAPQRAAACLRTPNKAPQLKYV